MTATLFANRWHGLESERAGVAAEDGQWYEAVDTGVEWFRKNGAWVLDPFVFVKSVKSGRITTDGDGFYHVTFTTPFEDNDYGVLLTCEEIAGPQTMPHTVKNNLTAEGFDIYTYNLVNNLLLADAVVSWQAAKHNDP